MVESVSSETPDGGVQLGGTELQLKVRVAGTTDAKQKLYKCFSRDSGLPMTVSDTQSTAPSREEEEAGGTAAVSLPEDLKQYDPAHTVQELGHDSKANDEDACMAGCTKDENCKAWAWFGVPPPESGKCVRLGPRIPVKSLPGAKDAAIVCMVLDKAEDHEMKAEEDGDSTFIVAKRAPSPSSRSGPLKVCSGNSW